MRDKPGFVGGVARKSATEVIIDAALRDGLEGFECCGLEGRAALVMRLLPEEGKQGGLRKFGCSAQAAVFGVAGVGDCMGGLGDFGEGWNFCVRLCGGLPEMAGQGVTAGDGAVTVGVPQVADGGENLQKAGSAITWFGWEVGATPEGFEVWCQEHGERPTALLSHCMQGCHIESVNIRALFAVELDVDVVFVHESCDLGVLETLMCHDVAPMAGGISAGEENGPVGVARSCEGGWPPAIPVDWVCRMLEEVGACFLSEMVHALEYDRGSCLDKKNGVDSNPK